MLDCLIAGDSIAVGTKMFAPTECVSYAQKGYTSFQWNNKFGSNNLDANVVVISLGTNDHKYNNTEHELRKLRNHVHAVTVFWIMPPCNEYFCKPNVNEVVTKLANEYGDTIIRTDKVEHDHIHPNVSGYKELVKEAGLK